MPQEIQPVKPCPQCGTLVQFKVEASTGRLSCPHCGYILPQQIGHFKIINIIGAGGMGAVYQGLDISLERNVAIKIVREEFARNPQAVESFLREARAAAALNHPNIAQIYSFGEHSSRYYLVMEFLPHGSLDDRIERERRVHELEVLDIGIQIASGLQAAHDRGLIHRDIKPGNILFTQDGTAKVVDFGLARLEKKNKANQEEGIWGTPYYIAPEKVGNNQEDFRSDIYSLGGTLFHALAGRPPFEAGTSVEVVDKHLHSPGVSLRTFAPHVSPQTVEVISRMLKKDPDERPNSYDELLNDLAYAKRFALQNRPVEVMEPESEFTPTMVASTVLLLILCLGAGWYLWVNRERFFGGQEVQSSPITPTAQINPSASNPPKPKPPPQPAVPDKPPVVNEAQLFVELDEALKYFKDGKPQDLVEVVSRLESLKSRIPPTALPYTWLNLFMARMKFLQEEKNEARNILRQLTKNISPEYFKDQFPTEKTPDKYPHILAFILLGKFQPHERDQSEEIKEVLNSQILPSWMRAHVLFDLGLESIRGEHPSSDSLKDASEYWSDYLKVDRSVGQKAPYIFHDFVESYLKDFKELTNLRNRVRWKGGLVDEDQVEEYQKTLRKRENSWDNEVIRNYFSTMKSVVDREVDELKKKREAERVLKERKAKEEYQKKVEDEKKLFDPLRNQRPAFYTQYDFEGLLKSWTTLDSRITTEENKGPLNYYKAVAQILNDLKTTLAEDVLVAPYDQKVVTKTNVEMIGKLSEIREEKLFFRVESGEIACRWADLPPTVVLQMGEFYLEKAKQKPEMNSSELAKRALELAVFTREYGLQPKKIDQFLHLIMQTGANIKDKVEQLFPRNPMP